MSGVAAALGGSKETLWNYFSSKEELFVAYLDEATAAFKSKLQPSTNSHVAVRQALEDFARHYTEAICSAEAVGLHRLAISESGRFPEVGRLFYERAPETMAALLATLLQGYMADGKLRRSDPMVAAERFLGLCLNDRYRVLFGIETPTQINFGEAAIKVTDDFLRIYKT